MKYLEKYIVILRIKINRSKKVISLDQFHYVEKILKKYIYVDWKPACTPYDPNIKLFKNIGDSVRQNEYASIFENLIYVIDCIRLDIAYVWDCCTDLLIDWLMSIIKLLRDSCDILKGR